MVYQRRRQRCRADRICEGARRRHIRPADNSVPKHFAAYLRPLKARVKSNDDTFVKLLALYPIDMKSLPHSFYLKAALLIVQLAFGFGSPTIAEGGQRDPLVLGSVRVASNDQRKAAHGYVKVYSLSDEFNDGAYYAHGSFAIYYRDGRLFKRVENYFQRTDDIIPWEVTLPVGSYTVVAQLVRGGEVRAHVVITTGRTTILDLDQEQAVWRTRLASPVTHSQTWAD